MSLEDLIGQDTMTISRPTVTKDTSGGQVRTPTYVVFDGVPVRVETVVSSQVNAYGEREVVTTQLLFTQQTGINNGDVAELSDGTLLRLTISFDGNRGIGNMDTFYEIRGQQVGQTLVPVPLPVGAWTNQLGTGSSMPGNVVGGSIAALA